MSFERAFACLLTIGSLAGCSDGTAGGGGSGGEGGDGGEHGDGCPAGSVSAGDGTCLEAGLPEAGACGPGERELADGNCCAAGNAGAENGGCRPPGVEQCAAGFTATSDGGCEPVLPSAPCASGEIATLGDTDCHPLADCGPAPWGNVLPDVTAIFVDGAYDTNNGPSDGTAMHPHPTIQAAVDDALGGEMIVVAAGTYGGVSVYGHSVRIWGRCPELVRIEGASEGVRFAEDSAGSELHMVAVTGAANGVGNIGGDGVLIEDVYVYDAGAYGIRNHGFAGTARTTVRRSLVERSRASAVTAWAADVTIEDSVIRDGAVAPTNDLRGIYAVALDFNGTSIRSRVSANGVIIDGVTGDAMLVAGADATVERSLIRGSSAVSGVGRGINVQSRDTGVMHEDASLTLSGSLIDGTIELGVFVAGATATVSDTVVRNTRSNESDGSAGQALHLQPGEDEAGSLLTARSVLLEGNQTGGVVALASDVYLNGALVRNTMPSDAGNDGFGVVAVNIDGHRSRVTVDGARMTDNHSHGVVVIGSDATLRGLDIADTAPVNGLFGRGVEIGSDLPAGQFPTVVLEDSRIQRSTDFGVFLGNADASIRGLHVSGTLPSQREQRGIGVGAFGGEQDETFTTLTLVDALLEDNHSGGLLLVGSDATVDALAVRRSTGEGVRLQPALQSERPSSMSMRRSLVESSQGAGVSVVGSQLSLELTVIEGVSPVGESYGDGLLALSTSSRANVTVNATRIEQAARAAIANFGATVAVGGTDLSCSAIYLHGDDLPTQQLRFDDQGGNSCGCNGNSEVCRVLSAEIGPPEPLPEVVDTADKPDPKNEDDS